MVTANYDSERRNISEMDLLISAQLIDITINKSLPDAEISSHSWHLLIILELLQGNRQALGEQKKLPHKIIAYNPITLKKANDMIIFT